VDEKKAVKYLESQIIDHTLALQLYKLVGGRLVHLEMVVNYIKNQNMDFNGMYGAVCYAGNRLSFSL